MTAAEWLKKLVESDEETYMELSDVQAILDDGRVQGMREAADWLDERPRYSNPSVAIRNHAAKLAKGEK